MGKGNHDRWSPAAVSFLGSMHLGQFRQEMKVTLSAQEATSVTESSNVEKRRAGGTEPRTSP